MPEKNKNELKILFIGDIVGRPGRNVVRNFLKNKNYDFVIANGENASHGFGLTQRNYNELLEAGIDCITSGNHIWDKTDIYKYIDKADKLIRPLNYSGAQGQGWRIFEIIKKSEKISIAVVNLLGKTFMPPVDCPFKVLEKEIKKIKKLAEIIIVDIHAEATAEKISFAHFASKLGVKAVLGTHTHVQTADEKIIKGCAYISDAGFCGAYNSVIGMEIKGSLNRLLTCIPKRFEVASGEQFQVNAAEIKISKNGIVKSIKRINEINEAEK